jgi:hypothetical protein
MSHLFNSHAPPSADHGPSLQRIPAACRRSSLILQRIGEYLTTVEDHEPSPRRSKSCSTPLLDHIPPLQLIMSHFSDRSCPTLQFIMSHPCIRSCPRPTPHRSHPTPSVDYFPSLQEIIGCLYCRSCPTPAEDHVPHLQ